MLLGQKVLQVGLVVEVQNVVRAPRADAAQAEPETLQSFLYGATIYDIHLERGGVPPSSRHSIKVKGVEAHFRRILFKEKLWAERKWETVHCSSLALDLSNQSLTMELFL